MRILLIILLTLSGFLAKATNYYISTAAGSNDMNNGLSIGTAWRSLTKASLQSYNPGDSILLRSGDTLYGTLRITRNGTVANPIVISSFGVGARPMISGMSLMHDWIGVVGRTNVYQCNVDSTLKVDCNVLTINGVPQHVGRTPWMVYNKATDSSLIAFVLTGTPSYVGTELVFRNNAYAAQRCLVTSQVGNTVKYSQTGTRAIDAGQRVVSFPISDSLSGFFFQRFSNSLDVNGEWYYNKTANTMQMYSTVDPNTLTIKASYVDTLIALDAHSWVTMNNLALDGATMYGAAANGGDGLVLQNCTVTNSTKGVMFWNVNKSKVISNIFNNIFNNAILCSNNQRKQMDIIDNTITNVGQLFGMGLYWSDNNFNGIVGKTSGDSSANYVNIVGNVVRNVGLCGIKYQGSNVTVRRNLIDTFCNQLDDNGGIYTFAQNRVYFPNIFVNRIVDSNIVIHGVGAPIGTPGNSGIDVGGIYDDDQSDSLNHKHNLVAFVAGNAFQCNTPRYVQITDNTIFGCDWGIAIGRYKHSPDTIHNSDGTITVIPEPIPSLTGNIVKKNIIYQTNGTSQYIASHANTDLTSPSMTRFQSITNMAYMDSNWISNLKTQGFMYFPNPIYTLQVWKDSTTHDRASILPPVSYTGTNVRLEYNASMVPKTVTFTDSSKIDPKGVVYNNFATIPAWSSLILINNGLVPVTNIPPVPNAGSDKAITLPVNTISVTGSATDADGTISSHIWAPAGTNPAAAVIATPMSYTTTINGMTVAGTYKFQLIVTDDQGSTKMDTMQVVVSPVPNISPTAITSADTTMTLPANSATLSSSGSFDPDGIISSRGWVKISGPATGTLVTPSGSTTVFNNLVAGIYKIELTVTDNLGATGKDTVTVIVNPAANIPPSVEAGTPKSITLPTSSVSEVATVSDSDGSVASISWSNNVGNPTTAIFTPGNSSTTTISNMTVAGTYNFTITVTDNQGAVSTDGLQVVVSPISNVAPVANAGTDITVVQPATTTTLNGSGTDADGSIAGYSWRKILGGAVTIASTNTASTGLSGLSLGTYQFELTVTDNGGLTNKDTVQVVVNAPPNQAPTASAGPPQNLTLPVSSATLTSAASTDPEGQTMTRQWSYISGPISPIGIIFSNATGITTGVSGMSIVGQYTYLVRVTDPGLLFSEALVVVTVNPALPPPNQSPTADAGGDRGITLPTNSLVFTAVASSDPEDGAVSGWSWVQISGPNSATNSNPTAQVTTIGVLIQGTYRFRLTVSDHLGATGSIVVTITVNQAANVLPTAGAGVNQTLILPTSTTTLVGTSSDIDGTVASNIWTQIDGPNIAIMATPNSLSNAISGLIVGIYDFQMEVTDDRGGKSQATVKITVQLAPNINPVANAGTNIIIMLPTSSATLSGSGTDADGTVDFYRWTKKSGPGSGIISTPDAASTTLTGLVQGDYIFTLTITDNRGGTSQDDVQVTVKAANQSPVATITPVNPITLPINSVTLFGFGTDSDGTIQSFHWAKVLGPTGGDIISPDSATTVIGNLVEGLYLYELTVTDNSGAMGVKAVTVRVNAVPNPSQYYKLRWIRVF